MVYIREHLPTVDSICKFLPKWLTPTSVTLRGMVTALKNSQERHRNVFLRAPVPLHVMDQNGIITEVSDRWVGLLGYQRDEVIGKHIGEFQEDGGDITRKEIAEFLGTGVAEDRPRRYVHRDGRIFDTLVSAHLEKNPDGSPNSIIGCVVDVTHHKAAVAALIESEERFRLLMDNVVDYAIFMLDPDGIVTSWNAGAERVKQYRADEIVGQHFGIFYTPEERLAGAPEVALIRAADEEGFEVEGWRVRRDGSRFWASVIIHAIRNDGGELLGFAKVTRDITKQRTADLRLEQTQERLYQSHKMEAIGQLTGGVAHDFNNVLQAVMGNLDLIRRRDGEPRTQRLADNAYTACTKAARLTAQLLSFARRGRLEPVPLDPIEVLEDSLKLLASTVGDRISLSVRNDEEVGLCLADRTQLEAAILNLVINSRDALDGKSGKIVISIKAQYLDIRDAPDAPPPGSYVRISVRDDGPGMTENTKRHCFEPFFTTKEVGKGTGLGLAQLYGFARQSGGTAIIESILGYGTEVSIYLPRIGAISPPTPHQPAPDRTIADVRGEGETILVVEDDEPVRVSLVETLVDLGYKVLEAPDADSGLLTLMQAGDTVDVVLTDMAMPGSMDGLDLAIAVRKSRPEIPVILVTGNLDPPRGERVPEGVVVFQKPYSRTTISQAIRTVLTAKQIRQSGK